MHMCDIIGKTYKVVELDKTEDLVDDWIQNQVLQHINTKQHTATQCNTVQCNTTHCNTMQNTAAQCNTLQHTATHCNTLQHTATHCNTLQHNATRCNTLHLTATQTRMHYIARTDGACGSVDENESCHIHENTKNICNVTHMNVTRMKQS